jgi:rubrerythrin
MSQITFAQAVRNAVAAEQAASRFYQLLAESTDDEQARAFFERMSTDEVNHAEQIEAMGKKLTDGELPSRPDDDCRVVETAPEWAFADDVSYEQALQIALEAENHAALYYSAVADAFGPGPLSEFFEDLSGTEEEHAKQIRKMMQEGPGG